MKLRWAQDRITGIEELDALQDELLARASQLVEAARSARVPEVRAHVARMREVAEALFASEELHLRGANHPGADRHAQEHRRFIDDLFLLGAEIGRRGGAALSELQVERFVTAWLEAHVGETDRDLDTLAHPRAQA